MQKLRPLMSERRQKQIDVAINSNKTISRVHSEEKWNEVKNLLAQGKSFRQIEKETGVSRSSISIKSTI